jgi:hypothetical protein
MSDKPKDLKLRTKAFALRVIRMYSKLPKNDTIAQVLGKPRKRLCLTWQAVFVFQP